MVKRGHKTDPLIGYQGFASEGIEIAYPITSKTILIICERIGFSEYQNKDGKCVFLTSENVTYYNSLQVVQSYRQVYCNEDNFDLVKNICEEHAEVRDLNRNRITFL